MQGAGLSGAGAAGDANDLHRMLSLSFQIHHMEPRRLFQPVSDGQTQPGIVRALGIDLRHVRVVKLPQGVKDPPCLLRLVPFRPQAVGNAIGKQLRILVKTDDTSAGCDLLSNICRRLCSVTSEDGDFGVRGIVAVLHPWGTGLFIGLQLAGHRVVYRDLPHHPFQGFQRHSARTEQLRWGDGQIQDGGLHPYCAGTAVHDGGDLAVHVLQYVLGIGAAGTARSVGAGGGDGHAGGFDDGQGHRMVGAAHPYRIQPACGSIGHVVLSGQDHGQGAWPELFRQVIGRLGHIHTVAFQPVGAGDVDDEGVVRGTPLCFINSSHSFFIQGVCA